MAFILEIRCCFCGDEKRGLAIVNGERLTGLLSQLMEEENDASD